MASQQISIEQLRQILETGNHSLFCETQAYNSFYQFRQITYLISARPDDTGRLRFVIACKAWPGEYQLWIQDYETLEELIKEQPFDINKFSLR